MLRIIYTTLNLCALGITLAKVKFSKNTGTRLSKELVNSIMRCGSVTIKFGQWFATKKDIHSIETRPLYIELQKTLENCPEHSMKHTKKLFKKSFGKDLESVIELENQIPIASGSVGQVYKGKMGTTSVIVKVMHPYIKVDYMVSSFFLRLVGGVFFRGVNIEEFLTNVRAQYDYNNEARNLKMMYEFYKDDKVIIIPRLIMHSKTIIVMTYEDGIDYSKVTHEVLKQKVALSILAFQRQNSAIHGYIHGDLHDGNWKVRVKNESEFNLIIYDFGLITKTDPEVMEKWAKAYQYQDYEQLVNIAIEHSDGKHDPEILNEIIDNCKVLVNPKAGMLRTLKVIIPLMRRYDIKMKDNFLSTLVSFALTENVLSNLDRGTICVDTHNGYVSNCLDLIAFCESRDTCRLLQKQLEEDIKTVPLTKMFTRSESIIDSFDLDDFYNETMSSELS